jgi:hypothetical protein
MRASQLTDEERQTSRALAQSSVMSLDRSVLMLRRKCGVVGLSACAPRWRVFYPWQLLVPGRHV